ncbi:prephenate dehydrogenase [Coriobacteriia bacterium Es71-Z0120]|uniref:prephenate dehydrogenase n=1 Tax=Parvivirga hydrogeniphila TaxID=2939460 RepID=UPI002260D4A6|nr:prephenate dehydrogenase [Parvivirga hydrogeniphila]MCL4079053.1 prephenate dehydrogenase [Parvivirga hydrogeniphila]
MLERVAVIGLGLIGGSVAAATRRMADAPHVTGVDRDACTCERAREARIVDTAVPADRAREGRLFGPGSFDLVVVCTPVDAALEWMDVLAHDGFDGIVTDVCSTKSAIVEHAARLDPPFTFIGGHPMAGSERSGIDAATASLFDGAYWVLTPTSATPASAYRTLHEFVTALGARSIVIPPEAHDEAVALISHVPHVTAAALVSLVAEQPAGHDALRLAAGGFKDMTRIAAGSPELWTGICMENAEPIAEGLARLAALILRFREAVQSRDDRRIRSLLSEAAEVRRSLPARWVPESAALYELAIPMRDRPGVISEITTLVGRVGCNIEDVEIDHVSEDSAVLRLVLTDEGDRDRLVSDLLAGGYEPTLRLLGEG